MRVYESFANGINGLERTGKKCQFMSAKSKSNSMNPSKSMKSSKTAVTSMVAAKAFQ